MEQSQSVEIRYSAVVAELDIKPEFVSIVGGKALPANRIVSLDLYFFQTWPVSRLLDFTYHILECKSTDVAAEAHPFVFHLIPVFSSSLPLISSGLMPNTAGNELSVVYTFLGLLF